jgi:hypothetical protein
MLEQEFLSWLEVKYPNSATAGSRLSNLKAIEKYYGAVDSNNIQEVLESMKYSSKDAKSNNKNPSKIPINGNIFNGLSTYRSTLILYRDFLNSNKSEISGEHPLTISNLYEESNSEWFSIERDMQRALRNKITSLEAGLRIIDAGVERAVDSGFIDITCEDDNSIVVIELKAGKADSRAIAQILGYMGDLQEEEGRQVRGILVAHDFDKRTKSAARVVPNLSLKKYSIEFRFSDDI